MDRPWSKVEVEALLHLVERDTPLTSICAVFGREPTDVLGEIHRLAIRYHGPFPPPSPDEKEEK